MRIPLIERVAGTTLKVTWVNSGTSPGPISSSIFDRGETLIHSVSATASGDGLFYAYHFLPTSLSGPSPNLYWLVNQWVAVLNANTLTDRQFIRVERPEVG